VEASVAWWIVVTEDEALRLAPLLGAGAWEWADIGDAGELADLLDRGIVEAWAGPARTSAVEEDDEEEKPAAGSVLHVLTPAGAQAVERWPQAVEEAERWRRAVEAPLPKVWKNLPVPVHRVSVEDPGARGLPTRRPNPYLRGGGVNRGTPKPRHAPAGVSSGSLFAGLLDGKALDP